MPNFDECSADAVGSHDTVTVGGRTYCRRCNQDRPNILVMDGTEHDVGRDDCCNEGTCECGGIIHYQPVYGGYYRECDKCHNTSL